MKQPFHTYSTSVCEWYETSETFAHSQSTQSLSTWPLQKFIICDSFYFSGSDNFTTASRVWRSLKPSTRTTLSRVVRADNQKRVTDLIIHVPVEDQLLIETCDIAFVFQNLLLPLFRRNVTKSMLNQSKRIVPTRIAPANADSIENVKLQFSCYLFGKSIRFILQILRKSIHRRLIGLMSQFPVINYPNWCNFSPLNEMIFENRATFRVKYTTKRNQRFGTGRNRNGTIRSRNTFGVWGTCAVYL